MALKRPQYAKFIILILLLASIYLFLYQTPSNESFTNYYNNNQRLPISVGILTHFAPKTLKYTLENYRDTGFINIVDDIFVVIQKSDRQMEECKVCDELKIRYISMPDNGKMASGFKSIYENARNEIVLFLENDFIINTPKQNIEDFLLNSLHFLLEKNYDVVRGRSRINAGEPNYAVQHFKNIPPEKFINASHLSESIYWDEHPEKTYPSKISRIDPIRGNDMWYISSAKSCNYTNNPYLCKRSFFKNEIYPHLFFGENIEDRLTDIWSKKDYKCVFGPGLFTHNRTYDGHS